MALETLREWLKEWRHFLHTGPVRDRGTQDYEDPAGEHVWPLGSML
jgi:hypothetical protein